MKKLFLYLFLGLIGVYSVNAVECGSTPTDGCTVTVDTTFNPGTYDLPNGIGIGANGVILNCNGASLKNENFSPSYQSGGLININTNGNVIKNCIIYNSSTGIFVGGLGNENTFINNTIISNKYNGIRVLGDNNVINGNFISKNGLGFLSFNAGIFISGNNNLIKNNIVENNANRNIWASGINNTIENNKISIGNFGITSKSYSVIKGNVIENQHGTHGRGIDLSGFGNNNYLENNSFFNNSIGIDIFASNNNTIIGNKFDSNNYGIRAGNFKSTTNNIITKNDFRNNSFYAIFLSPNNLNFDNYIWDNNIYNTGIFDLNESFNIYCVNNVGNHYFDGATGPVCSVVDSDNDGVPDSEDLCPNTTDEEPNDPIINGCSCKQILDLKPGENKGELKNGCSEGTIKVFTKQIGWAKDLFE